MKENNDKRSFRVLLIISSIYLVISTSLFLYYDNKDRGGYVKYEPTVTEAEEAMAVISESELININTADVETLTKLDGIGPATAEKIIAYRENNNGFLTVDELKEVSGIGDAKLEKIRAYITVG